MFSVTIVNLCNVFYFLCYVFCVHLACLCCVYPTCITLSVYYIYHCRTTNYSLEQHQLLLLHQKTNVTFNYCWKEKKESKWLGRNRSYSGWSWRGRYSQAELIYSEGTWVDEDQFYLSVLLGKNVHLLHLLVSYHNTHTHTPVKHERPRNRWLNDRERFPAYYYK